MQQAEDYAGPAPVPPATDQARFERVTVGGPEWVARGHRPATADRLDQVVAGAVGGDRGALAELLAFVHPIVVRYCRARLSTGHRSLATADDVAQEVCMAVMTALPTYRSDGRPFLAFVYGIAAHKVVDAHRLAGRSRSVAVADVPETAVDEPGPEGLVVQDSVAGSMFRLLDRLPHGQQEILRLRVAVGLSAEETARALGMTPGAVRVAQHRALTRLRSLLADDPGLAEQLI